MKKLILAVLMFVMIATPALAVDAAGNLGSVPYTTDEIIIDGEKDEIYDQALEIAIDGALSATITAKGTGYMLYSDDYIYLFVEVENDTWYPAFSEATVTSSPWSLDNVEFLIDTNGKGAGADVVQYRVGAHGELSGQKGNPATEKSLGTAEVEKSGMFEGAKGDFDGGYAVEFKVPVTKSENIGINIMISDVPKEGGSQQNTTLFSKVANKGAGAWTAEQYPSVTLDGDEVTAIVEEEAPAEDTAPTAAATFDVVTLAALAAAASLAGAVVSKKRK